MRRGRRAHNTRAAPVLRHSVSAAGAHVTCPPPRLPSLECVCTRAPPRHPLATHARGQRAPQQQRHADTPWMHWQGCGLPSRASRGLHSPTQAGRLAGRRGRAWQRYYCNCRALPRRSVRPLVLCMQQHGDPRVIGVAARTSLLMHRVRSEI